MAKDIVEEWDKRQQQTNLEKATYTCFAETFDWGEDRILVETEGVRAVVSLRHTRKMKKLLDNLITFLPEVQAQYFNVDLMLEGYSSFLKYRSKEIALMLASEHVRDDARDDMMDDVTYEAWYKVS